MGGSDPEDRVDAFVLWLRERRPTSEAIRDRLREMIARRDADYAEALEALLASSPDRAESTARYIVALKGSRGYDEVLRLAHDAAVRQAPRFVDEPPPCLDLDAERALRDAEHALRDAEHEQNTLNRHDLTVGGVSPPEPCEFCREAAIAICTACSQYTSLSEPLPAVPMHFGCKAGLDASGPYAPHQSKLVYAPCPVCGVKRVIKPYAVEQGGE